VVLSCPDDKLRLTMTLDEVTVNSRQLRPDLLFQRRPLNGVKSYDLAQGRFDSPEGIQPVEGRQ
jgi:hypothetical protein